MKTMLDLVVTESTQLNQNYCLIKLTTTDGSALPEMYPGQFVQVKVEDSPKTFLRRPISINYWDKEKNELWLLVQKVGEGTRKMCEARKGDILNLLLPLGNYFTLPSDKKSKLMLVGGGVGIAPILFWGAYLRERGYEPSFLIGARSKSDLLQLDKLSRYGEVYCTTEDGSYGEKGYVTNHSVLEMGKIDTIYTCGPKPMMVAIAKYADSKKITCEASLENLMACGFGVCLCCVENTREGNICVCTEGPVFNIEKLTWIS